MHLKLKNKYELKSFSKKSPYKLWAFLKVVDGLLEIEYHLNKEEIKSLKYDSNLMTKDRQNELWRETCFELFLQNYNSNSYIEMNFSPNGAWNIYHFDSRRSGMKEAKVESSPIMINSLDEKGTFLVKVKIEDLINDDNFKVSINAVLKDKNLELHYYALKHLNIEPDFHDPESFINYIGN